MKNYDEITKKLTEGGVAFSRIGGRRGSLFIWSGEQIRIELADESQQQLAQSVLDSHPYPLDDLKRDRLKWNNKHRDDTIAALALTPITLNGQPYTLSTKKEHIDLLTADAATSALDDSISFPTTAGAIAVPASEGLPIATAIKIAVKSAITAHYNYEIAVNAASTNEEVPDEVWPEPETP